MRAFSFFFSRVFLAGFPVSFSFSSSSLSPSLLFLLLFSFSSSSSSLSLTSASSSPLFASNFKQQHQKNQGAITHDADGHTSIAGAAAVEIETERDARELVGRAAAARASAATAMNDVSSRSHAVFALRITGRNEASGTRLKGSLNLVDLAGSERLARSLAAGDRARETCAINKSLSALGDVFAALSARSAHIPYRNSKLTWLLAPCLGGSGKTLMFVNVAPDAASAGESLCSLRFAAKVNGVETQAKGGAKRAVGVIVALVGEQRRRRRRRGREQQEEGGCGGGARCGAQEIERGRRERQGKRK